MSKPKTPQSELESFKLFKESLNPFKPKIDNLSNELSLQSIPFSVHQVRIDSLSSELSDVQNTIKYLERKLEFETAIYEKLKKIILSLTADQDKLHILEIGCFTDDNDLVKMEDSLSILSEITNEKYELKILKDRESEVFEIVSNFLKRFLMFLSKLQIKSESKGELQVHSVFYNIMSKFKFIYSFSKSNSEYYTVLCVSYTKKAKNLYGEEFKIHLNRIAELIKDSGTFRYTVRALLLTYSSLLECENNFLKLMDIDCDVKDIFSNADLMIIDFIDIFYKKLQYSVIFLLIAFTTDENIKKLGSLGILLQEKKQALQEIFLHQQHGDTLTFSLGELIRDITNIKVESEFYKKLVNYVCKKAKKMAKILGNNLKNLQIIFMIKNVDGIQETIDIVKNLLIPKIIERVFGSKNEKDEISGIIKSLASDKDGYSDVLSFIKATVLENCVESKRKEYIEMFSKQNIK